MRGFGIRSRHVLRSMFVVATAVLLSSAAHAQPGGGTTDRALATELFDQARALLTDGKYAEACPKFEESQRLDPSAGTLLNLANCHELEGKTATAWSEFNAALAVAEREGQSDRVAFARTHIDDLAPKLSRLVIVLPRELNESSSFELSRDGTRITRVIIGTAMPVDPGRHHVELTARGYAPWSTTFDITAGERRDLVIGPLTAAPEPAPVAVPPAATTTTTTTTAAPNGDTSNTRSRQESLTWIVGGAGAAAIGVGSVAGIVAFTKSSRSEELCTPRCNDEGYSLNQDAKTAADVATVSFVVGAVALGVAVVLYITRSGQSTTPATTPTMTTTTSAAAFRF